MKFCTNCGFKLDEDAQFCIKCGAKQISVENNNADETVVNSGFSAGSGVTQNNPNYNQQQGNFNQQQSNFNYNQQPNNFRQHGLQNAYAEGFAIGQPQHLSFSQSVSYIFANMFDFGPKVQDNQKSIYWWNFLLLCIFTMLVNTVMEVNVFNTGFLSIAIVGGILDEIFGILSLPAMMRRLNYLGKNKNLACLMLLPIVELYPFILMFTDRKTWYL